MEVEPDAASSPTAARPGVPQTVSEMVDLLKDEHEICLENGYCWDANAIQNLILAFLQMVRDGITEVLVSICKARMHEVFTGEPTGPMQNNDTKECPTCTHVMSDFFSSFLEVYFGRNNVCQIATRKQQMKNGMVIQCSQSQGGVRKSCIPLHKDGTGTNRDECATVFRHDHMNTMCLLSRPSRFEKGLKPASCVMAQGFGVSKGV